MDISDYTNNAGAALHCISEYEHSDFTPFSYCDAIITDYAVLTIIYEDIMTCAQYKRSLCHNIFNNPPYPITPPSRHHLYINGLHCFYRNDANIMSLK